MVIKTKWYDINNCPVCERLSREERGELGELFVKKSPDGKKHRHLTKKEVKKIFDEYNLMMLSDAEEAWRERRAELCRIAKFTGRGRLYF